MKVEHKAVTPMHNTHAHVRSGDIPLWDALWLLQITMTEGLTELYSELFDPFGSLPLLSGIRIRMGSRGESSCQNLTARIGGGNGCVEGCNFRYVFGNNGTVCLGVY